MKSFVLFGVLVAVSVGGAYYGPKWMNSDNQARLDSLLPEIEQEEAQLGQLEQKLPALYQEIQQIVGDATLLQAEMVGMQSAYAQSGAPEHEVDAYANMQSQNQAMRGNYGQKLAEYNALKQQHDTLQASHQNKVKEARDLAKKIGTPWYVTAEHPNQAKLLEDKAPETEDANPH